MTQRKPSKCLICREPTYAAHRHPSGSCFPCHDDLQDIIKSNYKASKARQEAFAEFVAGKYEAFSAIAPAVAAEVARKEAVVEKKQLQRVVSDQARELASLALARRSLLHYVERKVKGYQADWVHESIANQIEMFVEGVAKGESPRLILEIGSRIGKSELASDSGPAWILGNHPEWNVVITSYSDELPTKFSRSIREQLRSDEYRAIFPNGASIKKDDAGVQAWSTVQGGGVRATGVGGALLGFGANILIMDDSIKSEAEARNPATLENLWQWATSTAMSRLMPNSGVLVIAQRWGVDDLIGRFKRKMGEDVAEIERLRRDADGYEAAGDTFEADRMRLEADEIELARDKWKVVSYPALAIEDEYLTPEGDIVRVPEVSQPHPSWRLLRRQGESIHPKRFSRAYYLNKKRLNPATFSAMYQQCPISEEGAYFNYSDFQRYPVGKHPRLEYAHVMTAWDLAISTTTSADYTVGIAGLMDFRGDVYLLEMIKGRFGDAFEISDLILGLHKRWGASITGIEHMMISQTLGPVLKRRMMETGTYINLAEGKEALKSGNQDKKLRARAFQALCRAGKVFIPQSDLWDSYISEMTQFGASRHDDVVDASAWLGILMSRQPPPRDPAEEYRRKSEEKKDDWYNELIDELRERDQSYMAS